MSSNLPPSDIGPTEELFPRQDLDISNFGHFRENSSWMNNLLLRTLNVFVKATF
jgi:hypothetical protein